MTRNHYVIIICLLFLGGVQAARAQSSLLQQGYQHYLSGEYDQAIDALEQAVKVDVSQPEAYILLSASYLQQKKPSIAQFKADEGLSEFPQSFPLRWLKAESLFQQNLYGKAAKVYRFLYEKMSEPVDMKPLHVSREQVRHRLSQVQQALGAQAARREAWDEAVGHMEKAVDLEPDSVKIKKNLAYLYLKQENWEKAIKTADTALKQDPEDPDLIHMKASAHYKMGNYEELLNEYKKLHEQNPDDLETALTYAEILVASQKSTEAEEIYNELLDQHPDERRIYEDLIDVNERRLSWKGKRAVLQRMQKQFPEDEDIPLEIAETYEMEEQWGKARNQYDSLLTVTADTLRLQKKIAQTYISQDSLNRAMEIYNKLHRKYPGDRPTLLNLGDLLEKKGAWNKAENIYQASIERTASEDDAEVIRRWAHAQQQLGKDEAAIQNYRRALKLGSGDPSVYLNLSRLLMKRDDRDKEQARQFAERALKESLKALRSSQAEVEKQLHQQHFSEQVQNRQRMKRLKELNELAQKSFEQFTHINSYGKVDEVVNDLFEQYPNSGVLYYLAGRYELSQNQLEKGRDYLKKAVRYSPRYKEAHLALAELDMKQGYTQKAIRSYESALSLDPSLEAAYEALIKLYRQEGSLDSLCDRWLARYRADKRNRILREYLIEALHKARRFDEAKEIIESE